LRRSTGVIVIMGVVVLVAALLRLMGVGARSLWLDEFCTWHVSQMGLWDSLRWAPELTIPPLYQFAVRLLADSTHPPEWLLRMPAVIAGVLFVPACFWLGRMLANWRVGLALAILVASNVLQIEYSREARPYSMLVLGCTLSFALWYRLLTDSRRRYVILYVIVTTLSFHAHLLTSLTVAAQVVWWAVFIRKSEGKEHWRRPLVAILMTALLCIPLLWRSVYYRGSISQAVEWINPPTWDRVAGTLGDLTFGWLYMPLALVLAVAGVWWAKRNRIAQPRSAEVMSSTGNVPVPEGLLCIWLCCAWLGLLLLSWLVLPMTVTRYALPAAVPALLLPLVLAARLHRHAPIVLATVIVCGTAPQWFAKVTTTEPGFREMVAYIRTHADPVTDGVALVIEPSEAPNWADMRRLALQYYPLDDREVQELVLDPLAAQSQSEILNDGRRWYLMVFRSDPVPVFVAAGRRFESFAGDGTTYRQLAFEPYRLLKVAPIVGGGSN